MTQVKCAQKKGGQLARYHGGDHRSLAARRAAFAAQMREMALSDLQQVSERLKGLHAELERKDGHQWPQYELAREMGIKPRTFQSWENGEVENRNGKGYDKMAKFYSRKLGRKITRQWILFGDEPEAKPRLEERHPEDGELTLAGLAEAVEALQEQIQELASMQAQLVGDQAEGGMTEEESRSTSGRTSSRSKSPRN